jgi:uncharacterized membrane protein HdeD (DUF308 family)
MTYNEVKSWSDILITGILMSIVGILMLIFRAESLDAILFIFGTLLLIGGIINAFVGIKAGNKSEIVSATIKILLGIGIMVLTALVRDILMAVLAIGLIIVGVTNILGALRREIVIWNIIIPVIVGIVFLVIGIYAVMNLNSTADIVMIVIGAITLFGGLLDVYDAYRLKTM